MCGCSVSEHKLKRLWAMNRKRLEKGFWERIIPGNFGKVIGQTFGDEDQSNFIQKVRCDLGLRSFGDEDQSNFPLKTLFE